MIGTDFMGHLVITLADLPKGRETEQWYKLTARSSKKDVVSGEVLVRILYSVESFSMPSPSLVNAVAMGGSGGGIAGGLAGAAGKRLAAEGGANGSTSAGGPGSLLLPNGSGGSSSSLTSPNSGGSNSNGASSARVIGEEEYSAMDDMRSGEIDLILPAIFAHSASLPCLQIGLPAFAKWATTASVAERVALIGQYKGGVFEMLVGSANEFKSDNVVVFYSLLAFGPFLRLTEAKPYFTSTIASLLAGSLQEPPQSLFGEDRARHCANCVIALANACTMPPAATTGLTTKASIMRSELKMRCAEILVSSGALAVAVSLLTTSTGSSLNKLILTLIIKVSHFTPALRTIHDNGFVSNVSKLLSLETDPVSLWLALDALSQYSADEFMVSGKGSSSSSGTSSLAGSSNLVTASSVSSVSGTSPRGSGAGLILSTTTYAQDVLAVATLPAALLRVASLDSLHSSIHGASIATSLIYLLKSLSTHITSANCSAKRFPSLAENPALLLLLSHSAAASYLKYIPKNEQKPLVAEYSLLLLEKFGDAEGAQTQKEIGALFTDTLKMILDFARFPSVVTRAKTYLEKTVAWGSLSKDAITDIIQRERESREDPDQSIRRVISDLLAQL